MQRPGGRGVPDMLKTQEGGQGVWREVGGGGGGAGKEEEEASEQR